MHINVCRERHGTEGSNVSGASLEHSSSVEVIHLDYKYNSNQVQYIIQINFKI